MTTRPTYPVFEANQVLSSAHLNSMFGYLDKQQRLTRANLIGVGIACGLEVEFEPPGTIRLSKGVGVTTEGYLIAEPDDVALVAVRPYELPSDGYEPFMDPDSDPSAQFDLWELFTDDDEPGADLLAASGLLLDDKAVLLFLELATEGHRNCSPNNCDDRGSEVTATVRRLLVDIDDLDRIIAATDGALALSCGADLADRLKLPDLRLPRVDVPSSGPVETEDVLAAFHLAIRRDGLVARTGDALRALYDTFQPIVADEFPTNPFSRFANLFGFLATGPVVPGQVHFMQYYWDAFDDVIAAYDELRWAAHELMCACCPPEELFPRHLMAGVLDPVANDPAGYRHHWVPSPAVSDNQDLARDVRLLFARLVEMLNAFTTKPSLPDGANAGPDPQIRITPSRLGDVPLSTKAIPYYYEQQGTPPLHHLWDPVKSARSRSNQNLSYRSGEYTPAAPTFVTDPLRFDLEPNNFLRIEGHLGKNVQRVLATLLSLKESHRLPFEVVALRTGAFDESFEIDLSKEDCRFEDLDTLYHTLRTELTCYLGKQVQYFYSLPKTAGGDEPDEGGVAVDLGAVAIDAGALAVDEGVAAGGESAAGVGIDFSRFSGLRLLRATQPEWSLAPGSIGRAIETSLGERPDRPFLELFTGELGSVDHILGNHVFALTSAMDAFEAQIPEDIRHLDSAVAAERYAHLVNVANNFDKARAEIGFNQPGLAERLADILYRCRLEPFEALVKEYERRVREAKQATFLSHFLEHHPGIQHKAGVPLGGTFILVYHELPAPKLQPGLAGFLGEGLAFIPGVLAAAEPTAVSIERESISAAFARMEYDELLAANEDVRTIFRAFTGKEFVAKKPLSPIGDAIYRQAVRGLANGVVIADFFLPYVCCSDCPPIQFTLPAVQLRVEAQAACTDANGEAVVTVTVDGASGPVSVQVDGGGFEPLNGPLVLDAGDHTLIARDATGATSAPTTITIPPQLVIEDARIEVNQDAQTYQVFFAVVGGSTPYAASEGTITDTEYVSPILSVADVLTVTITDAAGCRVEQTFESGVEPCELPCRGRAVLRGYRFWIPEARDGFPLNEYAAQVTRFVINEPATGPVDLTDRVGEIISRPQRIRAGEFENVVNRWLDAINELIQEAVGSDQWVRLGYEAAPRGATTGTLLVDRLECIEFEFDLRLGFVQARRERSFELFYNPEGMVLLEQVTNSEAFIPAYDGERSDKCRPEQEPEPICGDIDMELEIAADPGQGQVVLVVTATGGVDPVAFVWEVDNGEPIIAGGQQIEVRFEEGPNGPSELPVRVTAFTKDGCTVVAEETVRIGRG